MRNTKISNDAQCIEIAKKLLLEKTSEANVNFTRVFDYSDIELQFEEYILCWVGSEFIVDIPQLQRENLFVQIIDLRNLIKSVYNVKDELQFDYLQLYYTYFDTWSFKSFKILHKELLTSYINSSIADSKENRSNAVYILNVIEEFICAINKINKKHKAITK